MTLLGALLSPHAWPASILVILITAAFTLAILPILRRPAFPRSAPFVSKHSLPLIGSLGFFTQRAAFLTKGGKASPTGQFSFNYGPHPIISLSGEAARTTFYTARGLDLGAGFRQLFAGGPDTSHLYEGDLIAFFAQNFRRFLARDRLSANLKLLTGDTHRAITPIRAEADSHGFAVIDIFEDFFRLVYQLTHRTLGCNDIANDPKRLASTLTAYKNLDVGSATEIMFPWLPTTTKVKKLWAGYSLFSQISAIVRERRKTGRTETDVMQVMIDRGDDESVITTFIISALFAGVINSGINAAWILCYLAATPEWHARCMAEVEAALSKHRQSPDETPADIIPRLTMDDWESGFPNVDLCLRETIRMNLPGASVRQNLSGHDVRIADSAEVIPNKMFAVYLLDDVHMDSNIYKRPLVWDPTRYLPERAEDKKTEHGFLGWGSGLHPCLGMKFAKLEITISTVMFLAYYDFKLSDGVGNLRTQPLPLTSRNAIANEVPKETVFLRCTPRF